MHSSLTMLPTSGALRRETAEAPHPLSFLSPGGSLVLEILRKADFMHPQVSTHATVTRARGSRNYTVHPKLASYVSPALLAHGLMDSTARGAATGLSIPSMLCGRVTGGRPSQTLCPIGGRGSFGAKQQVRKTPPLAAIKAPPAQRWEPVCLSRHFCR